MVYIESKSEEFGQYIIFSSSGKALTGLTGLFIVSHVICCCWQLSESCLQDFPTTWKPCPPVLIRQTLCSIPPLIRLYWYSEYSPHLHPTSDVAMSKYSFSFLRECNHNTFLCSTNLHAKRPLLLFAKSKFSSWTICWIWAGPCAILPLCSEKSFMVTRWLPLPRLLWQVPLSRWIVQFIGCFSRWHTSRTRSLRLASTPLDH